MQSFMLVVTCLVMFGEFAVNYFALPPILRFLPEAASAVLMLYVIFAGTRDRFSLVAPKYWVVFIALAIVIVCGVLNSFSGPGPTLSGARYFLRAVPLFFLPAVLPMSDAALKRQLKVLLVLCLVQVPISMYQRWVIMQAGRFSGDDVRGTLLDSGILSMVEIGAVLVLSGLLMKGRIGKLTFGVLFLTLLIPTAIDETKATVLLLPVGLMVTLVMGAAPRNRLKYAGLGLAALVTFGAIFVPVYNKMEENNPVKRYKDITNYFTNEKNLNKYMSSGVGGVGTKLNIRRGDAIMVPLQFLAKDPVTLAFGLGLGSVAPASLGKNSEGPYFGLFQNFIIISFTYFVLQVGLFGVSIILYLFWMVFRDTLWVAHRDDGLAGAIAAGWTGVVALYAISVFYNVYHDFASVTYLYGYFSGVICARRVWLTRQPQPAVQRTR
jgi:hypothetical protein